MIGPETTPDTILTVLERHAGPLSAEQIAQALASGGIVPRHGVSKMVIHMRDRGLLRCRRGRYSPTAVWRRGSDGQFVAVGSVRGVTQHADVMVGI